MMNEKQIREIVEVAQYVLSEPWRFASGDEILAQGIIDLAAHISELTADTRTGKEQHGK